MKTDELIDVINEEGKVIRTISREEAEQDNHLTQNVLVFIFTPKGEVWIQKRPQNKKHFPGLWDISACGGMTSGESAEIAAEREQSEEMGFACELSQVETFLNEFTDHKGLTYRRLSHLFIGISKEIPQVNPEVDEFLAVDHSLLEVKIRNEEKAYVPSFLMELEKAVAAHKERINYA